MKFLKGYENGNHITKIYDDGTKIKETGHFEFRPLPGMKGGPKVWVPDDADHFTYDFQTIRTDTTFHINWIIVDEIR